MQPPLRCSRKVANERAAHAEPIMGGGGIKKYFTPARAGEGTYIENIHVACTGSVVHRWITHSSFSRLGPESFSLFPVATRPTAYRERPPRLSQIASSPLARCSCHSDQVQPRACGGTFVLCRADFSGRACCDAGQVVQLCCCSEKLRNACGVIVGQTASWISNARSRTPCLTTPDRSQVALSALRRCKDSTLAINSSFALTFTAWRGVLQKMVLFVLSTVFHAVFCCLVARTREATCDALHATLVSRLWRGRAATRRGFLDRVSSHALNGISCVY